MLKIAQLGQPVLRRVADEVTEAEIATPEFQKFIDEMLDTLEDAGGVGLAAPQVFASKRVFLAAILPSKDKDRYADVECFINPVFSELSEEKHTAWEGCLSFLELSVLVPRHVGLVVDYLDRHGVHKKLQVSHFPARVLQHENDHLDGILTIDRADSTLDIVKSSELTDARKARGEGEEDEDDEDEEYDDE